MKQRLKQLCLHHLHHTFGLAGYRSGQKTTVYALLGGRDVLCVLPTGAGKSLCWQLPAVLHDGLTVVVSPLIALMRDQVRRLTDLGIPAVSIDSLMGQEERAAAFDRIRRGETRIVFVSPERLENPRFRQLCQQVVPWLMVVDEAHCVVQWGEHFRPAYGSIAGFVRALPKRPVLCAMTATADRTMQCAIRQSLGLRGERRILLSYVRENLSYEVRPTLHRTQAILHRVQANPGKTVVFCRTRSRAEHLAVLLANEGIAADFYHAALERSVRLEKQLRFHQGCIDVLCATTAFGMGVDIPDIRCVIHDYLPDSVIDYAQQTGRAGRDGQAASCILFLDPDELVRKAAIRSKAGRRYPRQPVRRWIYLQTWWRGQQRLLNILLTAPCIPRSIVRAFGGQSAPCGCCSACRKSPLVRRIPPFSRMGERQIRAWLLSWQREALAVQQGCLPAKVISDHALEYAAKMLVFPAEAKAPPEMERLLKHFRRERMHESVQRGIS